jgi:hypothetical protein
MNSLLNAFISSSRLPALLIALFLASQYNVITHSHDSGLIEEAGCQLCTQLKSTDEFLVSTSDHSVIVPQDSPCASITLVARDLFTLIPSARAPPQESLV